MNFVECHSYNFQFTYFQNILLDTKSEHYSKCAIVYLTVCVHWQLRVTTHVKDSVQVKVFFTVISSIFSVIYILFSYAKWRRRNVVCVDFTDPLYFVMDLAVVPKLILLCFKGMSYSLLCLGVNQDCRQVCHIFLNKFKHFIQISFIV